MQIQRLNFNTVNMTKAIHALFRRIVRNDAIAVDPPEVYNWRVLALAASVCYFEFVLATD